MCDVYMFVHLRVGGSVGLLWPGKQGMGCLVIPGHHSFPTGSHSPAPSSVASKEGIITVSRDPLSLFNKPRGPQPTAEQPQAVTVLFAWQNCYATPISPLETKWGKWCTLSGTWPVVLQSSWSQWPERPCSKACSHRPVKALSPVSTPSQHETKLGLATCGLLSPIPLF